MKTITLKSSKPFLATVAIACLACVSLSAHADGNTTGAATRTVGYSDLNLNTQAGAATLYKRIRSAAELVCGDVGSRQLEQAAAARACVDRAVGSSVRSVNNMNLTSVYQIHGNGMQKQITVASAK
jgi:UrcA family protein